MDHIINYVFNYPAFPTLWIAHCLMMALNLRFTLIRDDKEYFKKYPLNIYLLAAIYTFPGGILSNALLAEPIFAVLTNTSMMTSWAISVYLIFYAPFDIIHQVINKFYLKIPLSACQDALRIQLVWNGVKTILKIHPNSFLYPVVFSIVKSSGFMFVKYIEHIIITRSHKPFSVPNYATKSCILAGILFTAHSLGYLDYFVTLTIQQLYFGITLMVLVLRLFTSFWNPMCDPYSLIENITCSLMFGIPESGKETEKVTKEEKKTK